MSDESRLCEYEEALDKFAHEEHARAEFYKEALLQIARLVKNALEAGSGD